MQYFCVCFLLLFFNVFFVFFQAKIAAKQAGNSDIKGLNLIVMFIPSHVLENKSFYVSGV